MPVIIDGTNGISGVDGSASTPAVQGTDTNTGMFFPAADTIAFAEGGTEVMRIDSSGNLRVGSSSTSLNSINSTNTFGFKNRIINGAMMIDQRNNGSSVSVGTNSSVYVLDRWTVYPIGSGCTAQRVAGLGTYRNAIRVTGAAGNSQVQVMQKIESLNTYDLVNQNITISFTASTSSNKTVSIYLVYPNTVDSWGGGYSQIAVTTVNITSTAQTFSVTFNAGTNAVNGLGIIFADAQFLAGETMTITGVQLEKGSTATSFDYRPYGTELALCQRYYWQQNSETSFAGIASGQMNAATTARFTIRYPQPMRASPTVSVTSIGSLLVNQGGTDLIPTAITTYVNSMSALVDFTVPSGTLGRGANLIFANVSTGSIQASAEL